MTAHYHLPMIFGTGIKKRNEEIHSLHDFMNFKSFQFRKSVWNTATYNNKRIFNNKINFRLTLQYRMYLN